MPHSEEKGVRFGLRGRLLLAFLAISLCAAATAGSAIYALFEVGRALNIVTDKRLPPLIASAQLSLVAQKIVGAAPLLRDAPSVTQNDVISSRIETDVDYLDLLLADFRKMDVDAMALDSLLPVFAEFRKNLDRLLPLYSSRSHTSEHKRLLSSRILEALSRIESTLRPEAEHAAANIRTYSAALLEPELTRIRPETLASALNNAVSLQIADSEVAKIRGEIADAISSVDSAQQSEILNRLRSSLHNYGPIIQKLAPSLQRPLVGFLDEMESAVNGNDGFAETLRRELALTAEGEALLALNENLSERLTAAVGRLTRSTQLDAEDANENVQSVRRSSAQALSGIVAASVIASIIIVWLYVGRSVIRRLTALSESTLAIAGGRLDVPVVATGTDEVAAMGRAVEVFRRNAVELNQLILEREKSHRLIETAHQELTQSVNELRALGEVTQAVNSTLDLEIVLSTIVAKAVQLSGTEAGTIYVFDEANQEFRLRASYGMDDALIAAVKSKHIHMGETVISKAVLQRMPMQIYDVQHDPSLPVLDVILRAGFRSLLTIPLLGADRVVGALVVRRKEPGEFSNNTIDLLQTFGAQSVLAIQNARLFKEIKEKGQQLEIASQHKSQFVANMSHELRTPLAAMLGYAELMQEGLYGPLSDKANAILARMQSNGKHLLGLINMVLDLSKIEAGQFSLDLVEYSLGSIVETVRVATESLAAGKKLALKTNVAKDLPHGLGDEQRLTQVLLNLVGNAIKFTDTGEVRITASAANGHFNIGVSDTGPGIPLEEHDRIFEQFHQIDSSHTKTKGGTGLGLAIAKQIVEMHGGHIWVDSIPGKGATFHIELPARAESLKRAS